MTSRNHLVLNCIRQIRELIIVPFFFILLLSTATAQSESNWRKDIRIAEDFISLLALLQQSPDLREFTPVSIKADDPRQESEYYYDIASQKTVKDENVIGGLYFSGSIFIVNTKGTPSSRKIVEYKVRVNGMNPRPTREEGRAFSPFAEGSLLALCKRTPDFGKGDLTDFPVTYVLSYTWEKQIFEILNSSKLSSSYLQKLVANSSLEFAIWANKINVSTKPSEIVAILAGVDKYSRAVAIATVLDNKVPVISELIELITNSNSAEYVDGLALGVLLFLKNNAPDKQYIPVLKALLAYYKKSPQADGSKYVTKRLELYLAQPQVDLRLLTPEQ